MASIIPHLSWKLVALFMVTCVAVMVHSADDTDVRSKTEFRGEPRDLLSFYRAFVSKGHTKRTDENLRGTYRFSFNMAAKHVYHSHCADDRVQFRIQFESQRYWGRLATVGHNNKHPRDYVSYHKEKKYYADDRVQLLRVSIQTSHSDCSWFPVTIFISTPAVGCYNCEWGPKCCTYVGGDEDNCEPRCWIRETADIECVATSC